MSDVRFHVSVHESGPQERKWQELIKKIGNIVDIVDFVDRSGSLDLSRQLIANRREMLGER